MRTRPGAYNRNVYPPPPLETKQIASGKGRYVTPTWVMDGLEPELLPVVQKIYDDFNEERGTNFENPLRK